MEMEMEMQNAAFGRHFLFEPARASGADPTVC